jgi:hypothetical protein
MCAIFSKKPGGHTWGQVLGTTDTTPAQVGGRADIDGTHRVLGGYLVAPCTSAGFAVSSVFATILAGAARVIPGNWIGGTGSVGVASAVGSAACTFQHSAAATL